MCFGEGAALTGAKYDKAIELSPREIGPYIERGCYALRRKDYELAILDFNQAIKLDPTFAGAYSRRGVAHEGRNDHDRAIADFQKAIELGDSDAEVLYKHVVAGSRKARPHSGRDGVRLGADGRCFTSFERHVLDVGGG